MRVPLETAVAECSAQRGHVYSDVRDAHNQYNNSSGQVETKFNNSLRSNHTYRVCFSRGRQERAKHTWPRLWRARQAFHSTPPTALSLLRCSPVWQLPEFETSLPRPEQHHRPSYSLVCPPPLPLLPHPCLHPYVARNIHAMQDIYEADEYLRALEWRYYCGLTSNNYEEFRTWSHSNSLVQIPPCYHKSLQLYAREVSRVETVRARSWLK